MKYYIADTSLLSPYGLGSEAWRNPKGGKAVINETEAQAAFGTDIPEWAQECTRDEAVAFLNS